MSVYVLFGYMDWCLNVNIEPSIKGLKKYKTKFWKD